MKDKYTGDIGDYAKIILLNELTTIRNINLGVNWYYNTREYSYEKKQLDGKHVSYLKNDPKGIRGYASDLYDRLEEIIENNERKVENLFELISINPTFHYINEVPNKNIRKEWLNESLTQLTETNLIFLDPDNGICYRDKNGNVKHVLQQEIIEMYSNGKSLVIYNHSDRKKSEIYYKKFEDIAKKLTPRIDKVFILRAHLNSARDYVFFIHDSIQKEIENKLLEIEKTYCKLFSFKSLKL